MNLIETNLTIVPIAVILFTLIAVFTDLKSRQIPNYLTVSAFALALVFHLVTGGLSGVLHSLGGFATGFGILLVLWLIGGGGGGDVKLMGAIGAWVGTVPTLMIFIGSVFCALLCMLAMVGWRLMAPQKVEATTPGAMPAKDSVVRTALPYAVPAAMATWVVVLIQFIK
jgi:prepilin peptidase CpaA